MKKAFMRGVCALNIEAMSMFKEGKLTEADEILYSTKSHQCCVSQDKASTTTENGHAENVISSHTHGMVFQNLKSLKSLSSLQGQFKF